MGEFLKKFVIKRSSLSRRCDMSLLPYNKKAVEVKVNITSICVLTPPVAAEACVGVQATTTCWSYT